jgi:nucleoside-diphosphate-sugar epimerase
MNIILGSRGRLGSALAGAIAPADLITPPRELYSKWWQDDALTVVERSLRSMSRGPSAVYVATGIVDPRRPADEHDHVNFRLARNVAKVAAGLGLRAVTFGSIMEDMIPGATTSPYVESKRRLGEFMAKLSETHPGILHLRVHTLYGGGPPAAFMFLGQILDALRRGQRFEMTPGAQLREYHHLEDEVPAILALARSDAKGVVHLSHGAPVTLRQLAESIFDGFGRGELLAIGARPAPPAENYGLRYRRSDALAGFRFRDTLAGVTDYLRPFLVPDGPATPVGDA